MGASVGNTGSTGRRKSLDAEINLVPFIDLLSMCICFLLMTAVWMEIGALQVKQMVGTEAPATSKTSYEMDVHFLTPTKIELAVKSGGKKGKTFVAEGVTSEERMEKVRTVLSGLGTALGLGATSDLRSQLGNLFSMGRVTPKAGVPYGELVSVMDALRDVGIVNLGVIPVRD
jgi:biopolymer transport protein TolR